MANYSEILESYLIPALEAETEGKTSKEKLKTILSAVALGAIMVAGIKFSIDDSKSKEKYKRIEEENKAAQAAKEKAIKEEYDKYKSSPEYEKDCKYISTKYHVSYPYLTDADKKSLRHKIEDSIEVDLKKMASAINRNKKLCNELADKYIEYNKRSDSEFYEKYKNDFESDAKEIRVGPACGSLFESHNGFSEFEISDLSQDPRSWVCGEYLFSTFCDGINKKYYREIRLKLMTKMRDIGDGDEGLIGCNIM